MTKKQTEAALIERINALHGDDQHQQIINLIEDEWQGDLTVELTGLLARAYNNLEYGSEQIAYDLLMTVAEQSEDDATWHFRVAYSLFYMDKYDRALSYFERCKALNQDEENVDYFIEQCHKMISLPVQITPFKERVTAFWQQFLERQQPFAELLKSDPNALVGELDALFKQYFDFVDFEVGMADDRPHLVLSPNGMVDALIAIKYLVAQAPPLGSWLLTIGRSAMPMGIKMFGIELSPDNSYCQIDKLENGGFELQLYNAALAELYQSDQNKALQLAYIYSDTYFGELFMMQHCHDVAVASAQTVDQLPLTDALEQLKADYTATESYPEDNFMAYQMQFEEFSALREDVIIGNAVNAALINQYYNGDDDIVATNLGNGIVYFFLYYDNSAIAKKEIVNFRGKIEDLIAEHYAADVVLAGGATGSHYSYIDLISYDFRTFLSEINEVLADIPIAGLSFSVYRKEATFYSLSDEEDDAEQAPLVYAETDLEWVEAHIEKYFGKAEHVFHEIVSPDIHVDVHIIEPTEQRNYYTLVTTGMGAYLMNIPDEFKHLNIGRAEMMIHLPANWNIQSDDEIDYWPIRWLKIMARLPLNQSAWLGHGHSVPNNGSFSEMDRFAGLVLLAPALAEAGAESCLLENGEAVNFYNLVPLYQEEIDFKLKRGSEELVGMFEKRAIEPEQVFIVNINRPSAIAGDSSPLN